MLNVKTMWDFHVPILWFLMLDGINVYIANIHSSWDSWLQISWVPKYLTLSFRSDHNYLYPVRMIYLYDSSVYFQQFHQIFAGIRVILAGSHLCAEQHPFVVWRGYQKAKFTAFSLYTKLSESIYQIQVRSLSFIKTLFWWTPTTSSIFNARCSNQYDKNTPYRWTCYYNGNFILQLLCAGPFLFPSSAPTRDGHQLASINTLPTWI